MKKHQAIQTPTCPFPDAHAQGECPCFDDWGECLTCGAFGGCSCPNPSEQEPDEELIAAHIAWAQELREEGQVLSTLVEDLLALGRADDVDYDPERDYDPHPMLPPPLLDLVRSNQYPTYP